MFLRWKQPFLNSYLSTFRMLFFHLPAVFLLLGRCSGGQSQMEGSSGPILVMLGEDTTLPCRLEPATDLAAETVEWARSDLKPRFVHLWRDGVDIPVMQHPSYIGRTSLSMDKLKQGDISLNLLRVKLTDEGEYRCHIPEVATAVVQLAVGAASLSVDIKVEVDTTPSRVVLQCESAGWYPEPELVWLDGEENRLPAGPAETLRDPDGLFSISSRVTVERGDNSKFTCRVQQQNINQTRSTQIQIHHDAFMHSCSACSASRVAIVVVLSLCFMLSSAVLFASWKLEQRKQNKKTRKTENDPDEEMAKLNEKLKDKKKEKDTIINMLAILTGHKIEKTNFKYDQQTELEEMEKEHMQNESKLKKLEDKKKEKGEKKLHLLTVKVDLEERREAAQTSLEKNKDELKKTEDGIRIVTRLKEELDEQIKQIEAQLQQRLQEAQRGSV